MSLSLSLRYSPELIMEIGPAERRLPATKKRKVIKFRGGDDLFPEFSRANSIFAKSRRERVTIGRFRFDFDSRSSRDTEVGSWLGPLFLSTPLAASYFVLALPVFKEYRFRHLNASGRDIPLATIKLLYNDFVTRDVYDFFRPLARSGFDELRR